MIPVFIAGLYLHYPGSAILQIACGILWILLVAGTSRVAAYSSMLHRVPKSLKVLLIVLGAGAIGAFLFIAYSSASTEPFYTYILGSLAIGAAAAAFAYYIILYVICPLIILEKEVISTSILDYYKSYGRNNSGNCVRFEDDLEGYSVSIFLFQKFRGRVGAPVSYIKCRCPFGLSFIYKVSVNMEHAGKPSKWETAPHTKTHRRIVLFALVFLAVSIVLFFIYSQLT